MNREQLACAILTEYETHLPPGQQHTLGARVEAMLHTVDALKLAVSVGCPEITPPPSFESMFPGATALAHNREVYLQAMATEGDSGHRK